MMFDAAPVNAAVVDAADNENNKKNVQPQQGVKRPSRYHGYPRRPKKNDNNCYEVDEGDKNTIEYLEDENDGNYCIRYIKCPAGLVRNRETGRCRKVPNQSNRLSTASRMRDNENKNPTAGVVNQVQNFLNPEPKTKKNTKPIGNQTVKNSEEYKKLKKDYDKYFGLYTKYKSNFEKLANDVKQFKNYKLFLDNDKNYIAFKLKEPKQKTIKNFPNIILPPSLKLNQKDQELLDRYEKDNLPEALYNKKNKLLDLHKLAKNKTKKADAPDALLAMNKTKKADAADALLAMNRRPNARQTAEAEEEEEADAADALLAINRDRPNAELTAANALLANNAQ